MSNVIDFTAARKAIRENRVDEIKQMVENYIDLRDASVKLLVQSGTPFHKAHDLWEATMRAGQCADDDQAVWSILVGKRRLTKTIAVKMVMDLVNKRVAQLVEESK